ELPALVAPGAHVARLREHGDAVLVGPARLHVEEVHLAGGAEDGGRAVSGAAAVAARGLEGDGDHHHLRLVGRVGEAVDAGVGARGGVGVEGHRHSRTSFPKLWLEDIFSKAAAASVNGCTASTIAFSAPRAKSGRISRSKRWAISIFSSSGRLRSVVPWMHSRFCKTRP